MEMIDEGLRSSQNSNRNSVEEILRGKGALEYGELESLVFNKRGLSQKSMSMRSESEHPDMFCKKLII